MKISMDNEVPDIFKDCVDEFFETQYPRTYNEFNKLVKETGFKLKKLRETSASESEDLDNPCKICIEKIINELYDLKPGIGMGDSLGKYVSRIWQFCEIVIDVVLLDNNDFKKVTKLYELREFYKTTYEYTIKFLTEYAYQIALEKEKNRDKSSIAFVAKYKKSQEKGGTPLKTDLIKYLREQKYLIPGTCSFLQNSFIRNSICHENVFFDEKNNLLIFGKTQMSIEDFKKYFEEIYKINQFIVNQTLERAEKKRPSKL